MKKENGFTDLKVVLITCALMLCEQAAVLPVHVIRKCWFRLKFGTLSLSKRANIDLCCFFRSNFHMFKLKKQLHVKTYWFICDFTV